MTKFFIFLVFNLPLQQLGIVGKTKTLISEGQYLSIDFHIVCYVILGKHFTFSKIIIYKVGIKITNTLPTPTHPTALGN